MSMEAKVISIFGLSLGMVGVVMLFIWGPPQPTFEEGVSLVLEPATPLPDARTADEVAADARRQKYHHSRMSRVGLSLVFVGFGFQLWGTWL